jgi:hypothetical protein
MLRVFTKDVGRFHRGDVRDYPSHVWKAIAGDAKATLDAFTQSPADSLEPKNASLKTKKN